MLIVVPISNGAAESVGTVRVIGEELAKVTSLLLSDSTNV
jgi:hypothetical protein